MLSLEFGIWNLEFWTCVKSVYGLWESFVQTWGIYTLYFIPVWACVKVGGLRTFCTRILLSVLHMFLAGLHLLIQSFARHPHSLQEQQLFI